MRYQSSLPAILSVDASAHRARPTCKLSLANVSACTVTTMDATTEDPNAMQVDPPAHIITPLFGEKTNAVPFPTATSPPHTHSLLRPSLKVSVGSVSLKSSSSRGPPSPTGTEQLPPRKRTRTSALSSPKSRSHRTSPLSPRGSSSSSLSSTTSVARSGSSSKENEPFVYPFPTLSTPNASERSTIPCPGVVMTPMAPPLPAITSKSTSSRRRKAVIKDHTFSISLYRTLVHGLATRQPAVQDVKSTVTCTRMSFNRLIKKIQIEGQEKLLAIHLERYLLMNGVDADSMMGVIKDPGLCPSSDIPSTPAASPVHPSVTAPRPVLSYQQLVSSLVMRHRYRQRRASGRRVGAQRRPSKLAECVSV